ncbi:LysM peptidoglycan-binding domain-containing protein [Vagococcus zengguangii]|uniref:LysM peptidoglycan-binding domain-containing protein n=1 Tax=Vagococcus zengguangii TaxID=2571750 RepID=UPI001109609C|nr:LysM peptidoglycan-binding domain-containing protein [Vagococcus zengguangii]TLG80979.1 LysM peptidoglycan-binding domain-containing protein [Vagococcus zengguangii]
MKKVYNKAWMMAPLFLSTTMTTVHAEEAQTVIEDKVDTQSLIKGDASLPKKLDYTNQVFSRSSNAENFVQSIASQAKSVAATNDLYASVMIAQACLETGYGASTLSQAPNYNLFGIKGSYNGQYVTMLTWEDDGKGNAYWIEANFRKYPSYQESFNDNAYVLKNTSFSTGNYYYSGAWKSNTASYKDATAWLTGRYATDTQYGNKLNMIIETYNLTQYDSNLDESGNVPDEGSNNNQSTSKDKHVVVSGDTLYAIAQKYGTTVSNIKKWNNLTSDVIYIGQTLLVSSNNNSNTGSNTNNQNNNQSNNNQNNNNNNNNQTQQSTYKVKSGDTLYGIAQKYQTTVANLKKWNNLSSDMIYIGQTLKVSSKSSDNGSTTETQPSQTSRHTVKAGDTLYRIAQKYNTSVSQIKTWNNLKSDLIFVNQVLIVKK